jgi:prevent-host-death family protein
MARPGITRVGVRELRQHLSRYLRRVLAGERLEITDRGRPVARLEPLAEPSSATARLVAAGRASAPDGDLLDVPPPRGKPSRRGTEALRELREERM